MVAVAAVLLVGCDRAVRNEEAQAPLVNARKGAALQNVGETPMADRVAVIGLLNKRNGIVRNLTMKPGQSLRIRDAIVRLRACETTAPARCMATSEFLAGRQPCRRRPTRPGLLGTVRATR